MPDFHCRNDLKSDAGGLALDPCDACSLAVCCQASPGSLPPPTSKPPLLGGQLNVYELVYKRMSHERVGARGVKGEELQRMCGKG